MRQSAAMRNRYDREVGHAQYPFISSTRHRGGKRRSPGSCRLRCLWIYRPLRPRATARSPQLGAPVAAQTPQNIQKRFEAAGIRTVYDQTSPAETADMTPIMSGMVAAKPDVIVGGSQEADAFAQMKALIQLKYSPKWLFESNGANSPADFPAAVGAANTEGVFSSADWYADSSVPGSAKFIADYVAKYGGTAAAIDPTSAEAYSAGMLLEAVPQQTGEVGNATSSRTFHSGP